MLLAAAKKLGNPKLATLATRVRLDAFKKVEELNQNERAQELKARDIEEHGAKIADLSANIDQLAKDIANLQAEIAEMQRQLKRAGEDRELENPDFQKTIADQRATKKLLTSALNVLKADAIKAETDSQKAYESFVKDTNKSIEEKSRELTNKTAEKADAEADKVATEEDKAAALNEQQQNENEKADLHKSCDFTLDNFDARQT